MAHVEILGRLGFVIALSVAASGCSNGSKAGGGPENSKRGDSGLGGAQSLFTDPTVPACTISSAISDMRVAGTLAGQSVSTQQIPGTYIEDGRFYVPDSYPTEAGYQIRNDLDLRWTGTLAGNAVMELTGGSIYIPEGQPGGDRLYCFSTGELAVYDADPMNAGRLFKFRLENLSANADCSGGPIAGALVGCIHRYNPDL